MTVSGEDASLLDQRTSATELRLSARLDQLAVGAASRRSRDVAWAMSSRFGGLFLNFLSTPILARILDPAAFGVVAVASVFTGFAGLYSDLGLGASLVRRQVLRRDLITTAFYVNLVTGIVIALVVAALSIPLSHAYQMPDLKLVLSVAALQLALNVAIVPIALLERAFRFKHLAALNLIYAALSAAITVVMALAHYGPVSLVAGPAAATVVQSALLWALVRVAPSGRPTRRAWREIWQFSGPLMILNTLLYWARNIDNLVLGLVAGAVAVGLYSRAYILMMVPVGQVTGVMSRVMLPTLTRHLESLPTMRATYQRALRLSSSVTVPLSVGLACLATPLVTLMFGPKWHGMDLLLIVLAGTAPIQVVVATAGPIYQALGETRMWSRRASVTAVLTMIALCGGAFGGAEGVAIGFAVSWCGLAHYAVSQPWGLIGLSVRDGIRTVGAPVLAALAMAAWLVGLGRIAGQWGAAAWLGSGVITGGGLYVAVLAVLDRALLSEWIGELRRTRG